MNDVGKIMVMELLAAASGHAAGQSAPMVSVTGASGFTLYVHSRAAPAADQKVTSGADAAVATRDGGTTTSAAEEHSDVAAAMNEAFDGAPEPAPSAAARCPGVDAVPWRPGLSVDTHARRRIYWPAVRAAECRYLLPPGLFDSLVIAESRYRAASVSPAGAGGLSQLMPHTAAEVGVGDRFNVVENIDGGARYLRRLLDRFRSIPLAVAAYNAGPGAVLRARGIPTNGETPDYVRAVLDGWSALGRSAAGATAAADSVPSSSARLIEFGN